jgi:methyl-accepting chemotaxis protein
MGHTIYSRAKTLLIITWFSTLLLGALLTYILGRSIFNELEATTLTLDKASQEIKEKILQQSETVALQSSSVHETTAAMDELNASFEHTRALAKDASNNANNSVKISDEGNLLLKKLLVNLNTHKESVNALSNQMLQLNDFTKQIHKVAVVINNLTGQTNILALNAAIQATHAKEHSEGFSVIAAEIRKLADESKKFLGQIDLLVENMTEETDEISKIVSLGNKTIHDCIKLAEDTTKNFDRVITIAHVTFESSEQVALNINQQASGVTQVLEAMELLTSGTKITAEGMKQVKDSLGKLDKTTSHLKSII